MVQVILNAKIEMPMIDDNTHDYLKEELQKDLQIIAQKLSEKATRSIKKRKKLKLYSPVA